MRSFIKKEKGKESMNIKRIFAELDKIQSEHKDDEEIKQAVKRIKDLLSDTGPYSYSI